MTIQSHIPKGAAGHRVKKIILHCGAPKTGTTSLQYYLRDIEGYLNENGIHYPHMFLMKRDVDPLHFSLRHCKSGRKREGAILAARARLESLFSDESIKTLLISNEALLGNPITYKVPTFFSSAGKTVRALQQVFEGYDVHVRYVVRNFINYIPSYYVQYVRRGGTASFEQFVASINIDSVSWLKNIRLLENTFGKTNIKAFSYKEMIESPDVFVANLFDDFLKRDRPSFDPNRYYKNKSVGVAALAASRHSNRILQTLTNKPTHKIGKLTRHFIMKPVSFVTPSTKPVLPQEIVKILSAKYLRECKEMGIDLS